jgi:hypothetical protein
MEISMKRAPATTRLAALCIAIATSSVAFAQTQATENDCFPACPANTGIKAEAAAVEAPVVSRSTTSNVADNAADNAPACAKQSKTQELAQRAEALNDRVKPVKEIIGYVRSPQGLAMKLVNDHVVKIPAWVGYAVDPVGSLKNKAMDEVRTRAKSAIGLGKSAPCVSAADSDEAPVRTDLLPLDTERV